MKHFKKRTIALVLASVITVVGAFGAENYKNSLMSLKFEGSSNGAVNVTLLTKQNYEQAINPIKKDATTYIIMLPETNSLMASSPELAGNVQSVNVRTMPYTTSSNGYTKITIKTLPNTALNAKKALYIPDKTGPSNRAEDAINSRPTQERDIQAEINRRERELAKYQARQDYMRMRQNESIRSRSGVDQTNPVDIRKSVHQFERTSQNLQTRQVSRPEPQNRNVNSQKPAPAQTSAPAPTEENPKQTENKTVTNYNSSDDSSQAILIILGVLLISIICIFLFVRAKGKMAELLGEQINIDLNDETSKKKKEKQEKAKKKKLQSTIKKLDKMYTKPVKMPLENITVSDPITIEENISTEETQEEKNVVDLDELFQEKIKQESEETTNNSDITSEEEENLALEDFLSSFSFTEEDIPEEEPLYNEELFNKFINDENLKFSKSDIEKIDKLLNSEISDDTLKNLEKFVVTNPIEKKPSHKEILENFVTAYTINQNITFTKDDIDALNKLISVEIDNNFITDLRTNPHRMEEMQKEFEKQKSKPHKTSELLTLNVKDMLPDLSEALKKQGGRKIESEVKPQVVYYSEGYDVSTISLKDQLPDLSKEINNSEAYASRPSDNIQYAETGYDVAKMSVADELPDLEDMLQHPEKYETPKETPVQVSEEELLKNISNVTFKPFYDGTQEFEVLNEFDESNAPTVSDMQEEFNQFDEGFEIINNEEEIPKEQEREINDFESLYDNTYVDFDKKFPEKTNDVLESNVQPNEEPAMPVINRKRKIVKPDRNKEADKLLELIEEKQKERETQVKNNIVSEPETKEKDQNIESQITNEEVIAEKTAPVCIVDNEKYEILDTVEFTRKSGCYLAVKSDEYYVLGYIPTGSFVIKHYETLKTFKMQARVSEKLDDGSSRYIVRIGAHKFILIVNLNSIEYVMDLC